MSINHAVALACSHAGCANLMVAIASLLQNVAVDIVTFVIDVCYPLVILHLPDQDFVRPHHTIDVLRAMTQINPQSAHTKPIYVIS